ncbi:hypothetical protein sS8_4784 [Methylocaldum marinum]|uniref:Uncharacterized protein n=1 Tax=Methylocaldum marinum TaxID=1432792 RepID=A0A250KYL2_9GAMM|nr:hypothetical protein sS8_4784 [Methylocaldum marinum]
MHSIVIVPKTFSFIRAYPLGLVSAADQPFAGPIVAVFANRPFALPAVDFDRRQL